ncbi:nuclear export factor GLE1 [Moraxella macacae 0408225]|uniref:Nuclear export factor GLE1 n=1 Tax=Moraxella macacae 0408225 TaxID=1230338 RepID=L2F7Z0_9GAMM|nr:DUF1775 domain-containing protein [Moraxella macacae]ELA08558.1 nuclear export factor GLE1 [Moraxella macacae 0408225]
MNPIKSLSIALLCGIGLFSQAQAHVTIRNFANGVDSMSGKSDHFRLNVPTNRHQAITKIEFVIPTEVKLLFIHPMPNWTYTTEKSSNGDIKKVVYTGRMEAGEYTAFPFIAKNPATPDTTVKYQVYITYEDGVVVPFDGSKEAKGYQPTILLK